ncbi:Membrane protein [Serratia sp. Tan611]|nr:Membrane protein [Serratia sp. Tan611]
MLAAAAIVLPAGTTTSIKNEVDGGFMGNDSGGRDNRIAGRDFNEKHVTAEHFVDGHQVNIAFPAAEKDTRPLVPAQRKQLNQLVASVAEAGDEEAFEVWRRVHAEIGVENIEKMTVGQYQPACSYLQAQMDLIRERAHKKELISALLKISTSSDLRFKLTQYCRKSFGSSHLKTLRRSDLQQALLWLDDERHKEEPASAEPAPAMPWWRVAWEYPVFTGLAFLAGVAVQIIIDYFYLGH